LAHTIVPDGRFLSDLSATSVTPAMNGEKAHLKGRPFFKDPINTAEDRRHQIRAVVPLAHKHTRKEKLKTVKWIWRRIEGEFGGGLLADAALELVSPRRTDRIKPSARLSPAPLLVAHARMSRIFPPGQTVCVRHVRQSKVAWLQAVVAAQTPLAMSGQQQNVVEDLTAGV
jgi:hypothetical protein